MKTAFRIFTRVLSLSVASFLCVGAANAADDAVLFKIHDIVPVKNADGVVTSCDLGATFYNRTANNISDISLTFVWLDEVIADEIVQEERVEKENKRANRRSSSRFSTASYNEKDVIFNLKLPPLKSYQQITLKSKVNTDRCFLLLNDMEINVNSCRIGDGKSDCKGLFNFISVKNPEYYTDFQIISPEEQKAKETSMQDQQKQELNATYDQALEAIREIGSSIQR